MLSDLNRKEMEVRKKFIFQKIYSLQSVSSNSTSQSHYFKTSVESYFLRCVSFQENKIEVDLDSVVKEEKIFLALNTMFLLPVNSVVSNQFFMNNIFLSVVCETKNLNA